MKRMDLRTLYQVKYQIEKSNTGILLIWEMQINRWTKLNRNKLINRENKLMVARSSGYGAAVMSEWGENAQTSSYKVDKS